MLLLPHLEQAFVHVFLGKATTQLVLKQGPTEPKVSWGGVGACSAVCVEKCKGTDPCEGKVRRVTILLPFPV